MAKRMPKIKQRADNKRGRGAEYTIPEREAMYQSYLVLGNKAAVARQFGTNNATIGRIVSEMEIDLSPDERKKRQTAVSDQLANRFYATTVQILDSIKPEDIESGRLPIYKFDKDGNVQLGPDGNPIILEYKYFGPKITEKAIASGIFTDKLKILRDLERAAAADQQTGGLLLPEGAQQLIAAIQGKIESIEVLKMNFRQDVPDLVTRIDKAMEVANVAAADVTPDAGIDFYNPGE